LSKLRVGANAVNPLRSQDFHLISTAWGVSIAGFGMNQDWRTLLQHVRKRSSALALKNSPQNPAQAETEDNSKIKDRLEALLFAETLQETLSPNANPGKWG
jgi:hypothetical protein